MNPPKPVMCTIGPVMQTMIDDGVRIRRAAWEPGRFLEYGPTTKKIFERDDAECFGIIWIPSQYDIAVNGKVTDDWMVVL